MGERKRVKQKNHFTLLERRRGVEIKVMRQEARNSSPSVMKRKMALASMVARFYYISKQNTLIRCYFLLKVLCGYFGVCKDPNVLWRSDSHKNVAKFIFSHENNVFVCVKVYILIERGICITSYADFDHVIYRLTYERLYSRPIDIYLYIIFPQKCCQVSH